MNWLYCLRNKRTRIALLWRQECMCKCHGNNKRFRGFVMFCGGLPFGFEITVNKYSTQFISYLLRSSVVLSIYVYEKYVSLRDSFNHPLKKFANRFHWSSLDKLRSFVSFCLITGLYKPTIIYFQSARQGPCVCVVLFVPSTRYACGSIPADGTPRQGKKGGQRPPVGTRITG